MPGLRKILPQGTLQLGRVGFDDLQPQGGRAWAGLSGSGNNEKLSFGMVW